MKHACPDDEVFADYMEGRLCETKRSRIERHISRCEHCMEWFAVAGSLVREIPDIETVPEQVTRSAIDRVIGSRLRPRDSIKKRMRLFLEETCSRVSDYLNPASVAEPDFLPVRDSKKAIPQDMIRVKKAFQHIDAEIEIETFTGNGARVGVELLVRNEQDSGIRVTLIRDKREISSHLFSESYVVFENLPPGRYRLSFALDSAVLGEYFFEI